MKLPISKVIILSALLISAQQLKAIEVAKQTTHLQRVVKTAKERLGKKYSDQQRINNCKVPIPLRGLKPRTAICHRARHK